LNVFILFLCLAPSLQINDASGKIQIVADRHIYTQDKIRSIGHVRVTYRDFELLADEIETDIQRQEIEALGHVTFTRQERVVHTERLLYRLKDRSGQAEKVDASVQGFYFHGGSIELDAETLRLKNSSLTTCSLSPPHYHIDARTISVDKDGRVRARHIALYLGTTRLFSWPSLDLRAGKKETGGISPRLAYSRLTGPSAGLGWSLPPDEPTSGDLYLGLSLKRGLVGQGRFSRIGGRPITVKLSLQEEPPRKRNVLLDRLPEVEAALPAMGSSGLRFLPALSVGYFQENPGSHRTARWQIEGLLQGPRAPFAPSWKIRPEANARNAWYGSGERYSSFEVGLKTAYQRHEETLLELGYARRNTSGRTPFVFDEVDLTDELAARIALGHPSSRLNLFLEYDLRRSSLYNVELAIRWRRHCLEPRLTWKSRQRALGITLTLAGLGGE